MQKPHPSPGTGRLTQKAPYEGGQRRTCAVPTIKSRVKKRWARCAWPTLQLQLLHRRGQRLGDRAHRRLVLGGDEILELRGSELLALAIGDLDLPAFPGQDP